MNMKITIFDTETAGTFNKPFCYNIAYIIYDTETNELLLEREFVVEQVWHNSMLFSTAYYENKRKIYVGRMRNRSVKMDKFGYICQQMIRDFRNYNVERAFAFNSEFDENVFEFNTDWFKCSNPFDTIPISDIRGYVHHFMITDDFKEFCETHAQFTESGNYSTTAETMFRYITKDNNFEEEHTALADSEIELQILLKCIELGADLNGDYKALNSIERTIQRFLTIKYDNEEIYEFPYTTKRVYKSKDLITLKK